MGRPTKYKEDEHPDKIYELASQGLTLNQIAQYLQISTSTLNAWILKPEVTELYYRARSEIISFVAGKLIDHIKNDNLGATIFFLKTQAGWKEAKDISADEIRPVNINLSGGIDEAELITKIEKRLRDTPRVVD